MPTSIRWRTLPHLLTNADRHRAPGSDITITLEVTGDRASVRVHNAGEQIPAELFERIFEYGVSDPKAATGEASNTTRGGACSWPAPT